MQLKNICILKDPNYSYYNYKELILMDLTPKSPSNRIHGIGPKIPYIKLI